MKQPLWMKMKQFENLEGIIIMRKVTIGTIWFNGQDHLTASISIDDTTSVYMKGADTSINEFLTQLGIGSVIESGSTTTTKTEATKTEAPKAGATKVEATTADKPKARVNRNVSTTKVETKVEVPLEYVPYSASKLDSEAYKLARTMALDKALQEWGGVSIEVARSDFADNLSALSKALKGKPFMTADGKNVHPGIKESVEAHFPKEMNDEDDV
jgi:hypothetical protein